MIVYKVDEWSTIVILYKYDKRNGRDYGSTIFSDFNTKSREIFQQANYVVYIDGNEKKVMKDRGDGRDYDLYVDSFLTNKKRGENLKTLLG